VAEASVQRVVVRLALAHRELDGLVTAVVRRVHHHLIGRVLTVRRHRRHAGAAGDERARNPVERSGRIVRRSGDAVDAGVVHRDRYAVGAARTKRLEGAGLVLDAQIYEAAARRDAFGDLLLEVRGRLVRVRLLDVGIDADRTGERRRGDRSFLTRLVDAI